MTPIALALGVAGAPPGQVGGAIPGEPSLVNEGLEVLGLAALAAGLAALAAVVYRWYTREEIPAWLATLVGAAGVALVLNAVGLFQRAVGTGATEVFDPTTVLVNAVTLGAAVVVSPAGRAVGDRLTTSTFAIAGSRQLDTDVSRLVSSVGRVRAVELPEEATEIDDIEGYDPVRAATKEELAGKTLLVPRHLRGEDLRERVVSRIKEDYGVGYVDLELDDDGTVTRLGLGRRVAGIGTTLAPGFVAVAVHADPGAGASAGDAVQLWRRIDSGGGGTDADATPDADAPSAATAERVASGELRAAGDDVATVVLDEADAAGLDPEATYRLLTLPTDPGAEREFTSLLRAADETMDVVTVRAGSALDGAALRTLEATVAAVRTPGEAIEPIPPRSRELAPGDDLYLVARPERLREIAGLASAPAGGD